jgi:hypothetical protein
MYHLASPQSHSVIINNLNNFDNINIIFDDIEKFCIEKGLHIPKQDNYDNFDKSIVLELLRYEYVIFFTNKYFSYFKKPLLEFFTKCNILCAKFYDKVHLQRLIELLNFWIKHSEDTELKQYIIIQYKLRKIKKYYFFENTIEPNILYKKIIFSNEQLFICFEKYSIKKIEYKLKAFSQIAERMGAVKINIIYDKEISNKNNFKADLNIDSAGGVGIVNNSSNDSSEQIKLGFDYSNDSHNFNLNKFDLIELINKENVFFLSKEEFESDIDLNFLIDARCINFIKEYDTELVFKYANEWEKKIFAHAAKFKLNLSTNGFKNNETNIKIKILFLNIYSHFDDINGYNIHCLKEGFFHLANLIANNRNKEKSYLKIANFLHCHLYYLQNLKFKIPIEYNTKLDLIKTHNDILYLNFTHDEINHLFEHFFSKNLTYSQFKNMREIIIKQSCNFYDILDRHNYVGVEKKNFYMDLENKQLSYTNKLLFISYQYHIINNYKIKLLDKIKNHINYIFFDIKNLKNSIYINNNDIHSLHNYTLKQINKIQKLQNIQTEYLLKDTYPEFNIKIDSSIKLINLLLKHILEHIKFRKYIIKCSNESKIIISLVESLCSCAKKYNTVFLNNSNNNIKYSNFCRYVKRYIHFLPNDFTIFDTDEDIGDIDIDAQIDISDNNINVSESENSEISSDIKLRISFMVLSVNISGSGSVQSIQNSFI